MDDDVFDRLHQSLDRRAAPQAVAVLVRVMLRGRLTAQQERLLAEARYTPMFEDPDRPVPAMHKVRTLTALFGRDVPDQVQARMAEDPWLLIGQIGFLAGFLGWMPGADPTVTPGLSREQRAQIGVDFSARRYRKLVRLMRRTQVRAQRLQQQVLLRQMVRIGRTGFAHSITVEQMRGDPDAAAFVAYWTALRARHAGPGLPEFDAIAVMLLQRCTANPRTDWWMLARVYPSAEVIGRLDVQHRGLLIGEWFTFMKLAADRLAVEYGRWAALVRSDAMVTVPGVDWSTWNVVARAYNQAREQWLACLVAAGVQRLLSAVCPGKAALLQPGGPVPAVPPAVPAVVPPAVPAVVPAVVPSVVPLVPGETLVWAILPAPWEVVAGRSTCTARTVELACRAAGVEPRAEGWLVPPVPAGQALPVPAGLLDGIQTGSRDLAALLRRAGWPGLTNAEFAAGVSAYPRVVR